jgi:hypothetical protein
MIFSTLILISAYIANTILSFFPDSSGFPADVDNAILHIAGYVGILDPIVPLQTLATVLSLVIAFELSVFGFKALRWLFSHVPMIGGRG